MQRGRPIPKLSLTAEEQETLQGWARRRKTAQALALRARIVLACAEGRSNTLVGAALRLCKQTVGKWRGRFVAQRLDGLLDEPRPGAPRRLSDAQVEHVLTVTLESMPSNATHWSTRLLARLRPATPPARNLQAVARSAVHRKSPGHRGALSEPAGTGLGAVRG